MIGLKEFLDNIQYILKSQDDFHKISEHYGLSLRSTTIDGGRIFKSKHLFSQIITAGSDDFIAPYIFYGDFYFRKDDIDKYLEPRSKRFVPYDDNYIYSFYLKPDNGFIWFSVGKEYDMEKGIETSQIHLNL